MNEINYYAKILRCQEPRELAATNPLDKNPVQVLRYTTRHLTFFSKGPKIFYKKNCPRTQWTGEKYFYERQTEMPIRLIFVYLQHRGSNLGPCQYVSKTNFGIPHITGITYDANKHGVPWNLVRLQTGMIMPLSFSGSIYLSVTYLWKFSQLLNW